MSKISQESCGGDVFSLLKFIVKNNVYTIIPKRDNNTPDGWFISVFKNGKEIPSKTCKTKGNISTNKKMFQLKNELFKI